MSSLVPLSSNELRGEGSTGKALAVSSGPGGPRTPTPFRCQGLQDAGGTSAGRADFREHFPSGLPGEEKAAGCYHFLANYPFPKAVRDGEDLKCVVLS